MAASAQKAYRGMGMEGPVARWYEKTTRHDMPEFRKLAGRLSALRPQGGDLLEVAPGPGFLAVEMARGGAWRVTGLDVSRTFVELARKNAAAAGVALDMRLGNAAAMPFAADSFDLLVCRAAFKNFTEPEKALAEMRRVLRPGGAGLIIDLRRGTPMDSIRRYARSLGIGFLSRWLMVLTFRFVLLKRAYLPEEFEKMLAATGFSRFEVRREELGMEIWFEK